MVLFDIWEVLIMRAVGDVRGERDMVMGYCI